MTKRGIILIIVILIIGGAIYFISQSSEKEMGTEKEINAGVESGVLAGTIAPIINFNKPDYEDALRSGKLIILYFYANWCPICKKEILEFYSAFNELTTNQVIGFRINFNDNDTDADEEAIARQFGATYQHTKVFVKNGERILKSPESWNKKRYLSEIQKFL